MPTIKASSKFILMLLSAMTLAACTLPKPQSRDEIDDSATFFVDSAPGDVRPETKVNSFGLPEKKTFSFSVCVKDVGRSKAVLNQDFRIREMDKVIRTDMNGCMTWAEEIQFNYLADSQYLKLERHVEGTGLHKGVRTVGYAINPWAHGESIPAVVDLTKSSVPGLVTAEKAQVALKGTDKDNKPRARSLWVSDGNVVVTDQGFTDKGANLQVEFRTTPSLQLTKMNGDFFYRPLTAGRFRARFTLINSFFQDGKEKRVQLGQSAWVESDFKAGSLTLHAPVVISILPTKGTIEVGLEFNAVNALPGMTAFEGVYLLGEYDRLKIGGNVKLNTETSGQPDFKMESYADVKNDKNNNDVFEKAKFEVDQLTFSFVKILKETSSTKEIVYNIKACPKSALDKKVARGQIFRITHFSNSEMNNPKVEDITSDNNGCVNWDEAIAFNYFECQHYVSGVVRMQNSQIGMDERIEVLVNPWEKAFFLVKDARFVGDRSMLTLSCDKENKLRTRIWLKSWNYSTLNYDYKIDSTLNLAVVKRIQMAMEARMLAYSSNSDGVDSETKLRAGTYLLKFAVIPNPQYDPSGAALSSVKKIVTVSDGQVNTDLALNVADLKALSNRNNVVITLLPLDEKKVAKLGPQDDPETAVAVQSGLDSSPFVGPVTLNEDESSRPLRPLDSTSILQYFVQKQNVVMEPSRYIEDSIKAGLQVRENERRQRESHSSKEAVAQDNNLTLINLNQMDKVLGRQVKASELQESLMVGELSSDVAKKLCAYWTADLYRGLSEAKKAQFSRTAEKNLRVDCISRVRSAANIKDVFLTDRRLFVKELGGVRFVRGASESLSVGTSFSMSSGESTSYSMSGSASFGVGAGQFLGIGVGGSASLSYSSGQDNGQSVSQNTSLVVQQSVFELTVNKYEQCAVVRMNPDRLIRPKKTMMGKLLDIAKSSIYWSEWLDSSLSEADRMKIATRGLLVCSGQVQETPSKLNEAFYMINQEAAATQIQDAGDIRNRPFFFALRGKKDYARFVLAIKGQQRNDQGSSQDTTLREDQAETLMTLFKMSAPSAPGTIILK